MAEYGRQIPPGFVPVEAREYGKSPARHLAASLIMVAQLLKPGEWKDPQNEVSSVYEQLTGQPDIVGNVGSISKEQAFTWLQSQGLAYIDTGTQAADTGSLKHEMQAQNANGVIQLLVLSKENLLKHAVSGALLHNWLVNEPGQMCSLIRLRYSDEVTNAYYLDGSLSAAFSQPVPIAWGDIEQSGLLACISILPYGVAAPPADFRFFAGIEDQGIDAQGAALPGIVRPPNQWPVPEPAKAVIDVDDLSSQIATANQAVEAAHQALTNVTQAHQALLASLGKG